VGAHQTVIQSLGKFYRNVDVVSGATVMGDGRVALIMDIAAVVRYADRQSRGASPNVARGSADQFGQPEPVPAGPCTLAKED